MHYLTRPAAPACLAKYDYRTEKWDNDTPTPAERETVRVALRGMQGVRCAYCECNLEGVDCHIEHFRQTSRYPQGTFDWPNLFLSCISEESCGKHKDKCGPYTHTDIVKPDVDNPDDYFLFAYDGTIAIRAGPPQAQHRAVETIRVFNLDQFGGALRHMRKAHCAGYIQTAEELQAIAQTDGMDFALALLEDELQAIRNLPFATAIRHTLTPA